MGGKIASSTNGAGSTGGQRAKECELIHSYLLAQRQVDQGPLHKTRHTEGNRKESGEDP